MIKTKNKVLPIILALAFLISLIPNIAFSAKAATDSTGDGYSFEAASGTITVTTNEGSENWRSDANFTGTDIKAVVIGAAVTEIKNSAFNSTALATIDFTGATALETIGSYAFDNCTALASVDFTAATTLETIGEDAFYNCTTLASVDFTGLTALKIIGEGSFLNTALTSVDLTGLTSLTTIGNEAFYNCTALATVDFSGLTALTTIGNHAFYNCTSLASVDFSGLTSLETIGGNSFAYTAITEVDLTGSTSLKTIGNHAFDNCTKLASVDFSGLTALTMIGNDAFNNCAKLASVDFTGTIALTTIGTRAFIGCTALTSVDLSPATALTAIGNDAFRNCIKLTDVNLGSTVQTIGDRAFEGTGANHIPITEIIIPASVTAIGQSAFSSTDLETIIFKGNMPTFGDYIFENTALANIYYNPNLSVWGGFTPPLDTPLAATLRAMPKVTSNLTNLTTDDTDMFVIPGADYEATLTADSGYALPADISVSINSTVAPTADYSYNSLSGEISIAAAKVLGDIVITATGALIPQAPNATLTATGADSATLRNVSVGMEYSIDGGANWTDITDTTVDIASGINETDDILVRVKATPTTPAGAIQTIQFSYSTTPATPGSYPITPVSPIINPNYEFAFTADFTLTSLHSVLIDGKTVAIETFGRVLESSTKVILEPKFLKTLANGEHTIIIVNNDGGTAATGFTIVENASPISPATGVYN